MQSNPPSPVSAAAAVSHAPASRAAFHSRAFVSVLTGAGFLLLAATGAVLFLAPPGRVANWTNWTILGLRKSDWTGLHIWFSAVFLLGAGVHAWFNLRPLLGYFRHRATRQFAVQREWAAAGLLCAVIVAGTLAKAPPFSSLLAWNEALKESWDQPAERAPIPHAELLTFASLAEKSGVDLATATARLAARGISGFAPDATVQSIADAARKSARELHVIMTMAAGDRASAHAKGGAGGGPGWKTLAQFCADEGIDLAAALARLNAAEPVAADTVTLRELATRLDRKPYELVELLRGK